MTNSLWHHWRASPMLVRVAPFLLFVGITALQGKFGESSRYWLYVAKTMVGLAAIWAVTPLIKELRWKFSWDAVLVGVLVFGLWVGLDGLYPSVEMLLKRLVCPFAGMLGLEEWCSRNVAQAKPWNPHAQFAAPFAWFFILVRVLGSSLIVPPLEEVFYRSFLYRYIANPEFDRVPLNLFRWTPFLLTAGIFGFAHHEWLPGILCGAFYQGLVIRKNRLGDAMSAHAITNFLLGVWVVWKGDWHFW